MIFDSIVVAFSTYSRIPTPRIEFNQKNMRYAMCFFPLIGVVIGACIWGFYHICKWFCLNPIVFAAGATILPILITGGIHMDGFCDTIDALSSYQPKEKKLEILKDSRAGAFAIIKACVYFLAYFALMTEIDGADLLALGIGFVLSRTLSGLAVVRFQAAKGSGLAATFQNVAHKRTVTIVLCGYLVLCVCLLLYSHIFTGFCVLCAAGFTFLYYRVMSYRQFGGITGDLAGFFLQLCELAILALTVFSHVGGNVWNW